VLANFFQAGYIFFNGAVKDRVTSVGYFLKKLFPCDLPENKKASRASNAGGFPLVQLAYHSERVRMQKLAMDETRFY